ncbi:hypothetical protein BDW62DRAFT_99746 [Aspergillus aurantiobrunneus]
MHQLPPNPACPRQKAILTANSHKQSAGGAEDKIRRRRHVGNAYVHQAATNTLSAMQSFLQGSTGLYAAYTVEVRQWSEQSWTSVCPSLLGVIQASPSQPLLRIDSETANRKPGPRKGECLPPRNLLPLSDMCQKEVQQQYVVDTSWKTQNYRRGGKRR